MGNKGGWRVHASLLVVQVSFGLYPLFGKWALREVSPLAVTGLRIASGALLLSVIALARGVRWKKEDLPQLALFGLLGVSANQTLFIMGLRRTTVVEATIITALIPALTLGMAALFGYERPGAAKLAGMAVAFSGIVILVGGAAKFSRNSLIGDLLIFVNSILYSVYLVSSRKMLVRRGTFYVLSGAFVCGFVIALPLCLPVALATPWSSLTTRSSLSLVYIVVFATLAAYGFNAYALGRAPASVVAAYIYLQPAIATTSAAMFLGEKLGPREATALALVVGGTLLATIRRAPAPGIT